jgi:TolB-like protein/lipoprotein NlpI
VVPPVTEASHAVFLSYASQDAQAAQRICEALRAAGIEVWLDQSELRGGDAWDTKIREQISECALFLAVISANAHVRTEGYFRFEWKLAVDRSYRIAPDQAFLLPVVIDDTPQVDKRIPERFRDLQWTQLPDGQTSPAFVEWVQLLLSRAGTVLPIAAADSGTALGGRRTGSANGHRRPVWPRRAMLAAASIVLVGAAYVAIEKLVLSRLGEPASAIGEKSVAVLPFADLSEKHDQEYFADGMAEEIIDLLAKVPELKVIGRISSFQFKGKTGDLRNIGKTLGAAYIVEGSVRKSGDYVRVAAQLIDTRDGAHRWSETYDRRMEDVLRVQDEIALGLVRALEVEVASSVFSHSPTTPRAAEANDNYLRGLHARDRFDRRGLAEAAADFRQALAIDPTFAPAAEALALTLKDMATWAFVPPTTGYPQAQAAVEAALKLDPKSALAHAVSCVIDLQYEWDWSAAARECETAERLGPRQPYVPIAMAIARMPPGKWSEATYFIEAAGALNPLDPRVHEVAGLLYIHAGRLAEAEAALRRSLEISPTYVRDHLYLGTVLVLEGRPQEALTEMQQETAPGGRDAGLVIAYHALHRDQEAQAVLTRLKGEHANDAAMLIAQACAFIGDNDQAFAWLERAFAQKDSKVYYLKGDPLTKGLESDPRYGAFLRKMNLPE